MPDLPSSADEPNSVFLFYQTEDGQTRIDVRVEGETVWLSQKLMAELFQKDVRTINEHVQNIFEEGELQRLGTIRNFRIVQSEGVRSVAREVEFYNLDVIISVGYRVKSNRGTQFRIWATRTLREYIVKGFALDDQRLKQSPGYFEELLARIRDIRSSERMFYQKVLDIYATSADYDKHAPVTQDFFATVQNKLHYAAHGHTAAEIIRLRADASRPPMGMLTWDGAKPRKADARVAKNYLSREEIETLNLIVNQYLDFATLQARSRKAMYMADWRRKLDDFIRLNDREVLQNLGRVSHQDAMAHVDAEYEIFHRQRLSEETAAKERELQERLKRLPPAKDPPARADPGESGR
ncbi:RhuM family protein [Opitutales bacterium ASA1]|uniref:virulence RhuM family protein n=1 Tax=Congregicoccus parvus TaxID=3081749 RepID=UPI002B2E03D6|nr:RhuM family protein [Opitutales bacterium ASA1]